MPTRVFISYRRENSRYQADKIYTAFRQVLPEEDVFMDKDSIPPGSNFREILNDWVHRCDVMLALVGPGWIDATDPQTGQRRLESASDLVRIEIGEALARGIPVVPVLLDGAPIPVVEKLADDLKALVERQAECVEFRTFDSDIARLIKRLGLDQGRTAPSVPMATPVFVDVPIVHNPDGYWFRPGNGRAEWFKDHESGPEMIIVPAGSFTMGSPESEPQREVSESPQHQVTIAAPLAVGRCAVTRGQFTSFVNATGYTASGAIVIDENEKVGVRYDPDVSWRDPPFPAPNIAQDDSHPVVCVSWDDAKAYAAWLSRQTGKSYRLLTEAEWEYAARAGTTTPFWWGSSITPAQANYSSSQIYAGDGSKGEMRGGTVPVDSFEPNPWGLYNVHGNVEEWCEDGWHETYDGAPLDGSAWRSVRSGEVSVQRVTRGGSWASPPWLVRSACRKPQQRLNALLSTTLRAATKDPFFGLRIASLSSTATPLHFKTSLGRA